MGAAMGGVGTTGIPVAGDGAGGHVTGGMEGFGTEIVGAFVEVGVEMGAVFFLNIFFLIT